MQMEITSEIIFETAYKPTNEVSTLTIWLFSETLT